MEINKDLIIEDSNLSLNNLISKILWENSNPSINFENQNVNLSSDDYDMLEFYFIRSTNDKECIVFKLAKGMDGNVFTMSQDANNYPFLIRRFISFVNDTTIYFTSALFSYTNSNSSNTQNNRIIPIKIIGYKY